VIVAGSTHPGEEEIMLDILAALRPASPQLRLILARAMSSARRRCKPWPARAAFML